MILDAIVAVLTGLLTGLLGLFPSYTPPEVLDDLGGAVGTMFRAANGFFPMFTLGACVAAVLATRLFAFAVQFAVWVYDLIPFKAT